MARKGAMKWNLQASRVTILLHGKQQNTTLRLGHSCRLSLRSVVHSCFPCSNLWSERASKRRCPREALFKVVKVVQVVFPTQQAVLDTAQTPLSLKYRMNLPNLGMKSSAFTSPQTSCRFGYRRPAWEAAAGERPGGYRRGCRKRGGCRCEPLRYALWSRLPKYSFLGK